MLVLAAHVNKTVLTKHCTGLCLKLVLSLYQTPQMFALPCIGCDGEKRVQLMKVYMLAGFKSCREITNDNPYSSGLPHTSKVLIAIHPMIIAWVASNAALDTIMLGRKGKACPNPGECCNTSLWDLLKLLCIKQGKQTVRNASAFAGEEILGCLVQDKVLLPLLNFRILYLAPEDWLGILWTSFFLFNFSEELRQMLRQTNLISAGTVGGSLYRQQESCCLDHLKC